MENSILNSIKKKLPIFDQSGEYFDDDLIDHINNAFAILQQLGVGPEEGFAITDDSAVWTDFINNTVLVGMVRSYVYFRVWLDFDPPTSSSVIDAANRKIDELTWRLPEAVSDFNRIREEEVNQNAN